MILVVSSPFVSLTDLLAFAPCTLVVVVGLPFSLCDTHTPTQHTRTVSCSCSVSLSLCLLRRSLFLSLPRSLTVAAVRIPFHESPLPLSLSRSRQNPPSTSVPSLGNCDAESGREPLHARLSSSPLPLWPLVQFLARRPQCLSNLKRTPTVTFAHIDLTNYLLSVLVFTKKSSPPSYLLSSPSPLPFSALVHWSGLVCLSLDLRQNPTYGQEYRRTIPYSSNASPIVSFARSPPSPHPAAVSAKALIRRYLSAISSSPLVSPLFCWLLASPSPALPLRLSNNFRSAFPVAVGNSIFGDNFPGISPQTHQFDLHCARPDRRVKKHKPSARMTSHGTLKATFASRAETATHPLTTYLLRLMDLKASNLCLSADVPTARELLYLADKVGPSIVVLKTHHDIVAGWDFNPQTGTGAKLGALARKHGFLIFEDRKFGDIGNTVQMQYVAGSARIVEWAHIINVNMVPGKAAVTSLAEAAARWRERYPYEVRTSVTVGTPRSESFDDYDEDQANDLHSAEHTIGAPRPADVNGRKGSIVSITTLTQHFEPAPSPRFPRNESHSDDILYAGIEEAPMDRGLLILAQMSSAGNFMNKEYTQACVEAAREHKSFVMGFVSQESLNTEPEDAFIHMTPGCQLPPEGDEENGGVAGDGKGQQYNTPQKLVERCGTDIVIVGRGILKAGDPQSEAERYRRKAWKAYLSRVA